MEVFFFSLALIFYVGWFFCFQSPFKLKYFIIGFPILLFGLPLALPYLLLSNIKYTKFKN